MALRDVATASESYLRSHSLPKYLPADFDLVDLFVSFFLLVSDLDILNQVLLLILLAFLTSLSSLVISLLSMDIFVVNFNALDSIDENTYRA